MNIKTFQHSVIQQVGQMIFFAFFFVKGGKQLADIHQQAIQETPDILDKMAVHNVLHQLVAPSRTFMSYSLAV